jgi:hypothetical protein
MGYEIKSMSISQPYLKLIYGLSAFVSKLLSFLIVFLLRHPNLSDLVDLAAGGLYLSSAFVHILPRAESDIGGSYPYASLVSVIVFAALTLFEFIRDAIAIMDESILQTWDPSTHTTIKSDLTEEPSLPPPPPAPAAQSSFHIADHLPIFLLYLVVIGHTVSSALWITNLNADQLKEHAIVILSLQFLEFLGLAKYIGGLPINRVFYWVLGFVAAAASSAVIAAPIPEIQKIQAIGGYVSGVVLGFYFFLGSKAVHNGLTQTKKPLLVPSSTLLLAFAVPAAVRAGDL